MTQLRYAGGKILCLLGNPPYETATPPRDDSMSYVGQSKFGFGGVAGACRVDEEEQSEHNSESKSKSNSKSKSKTTKNKNNSNNNNETEKSSDLTDLTPSNLKDYAMPLDPDDLFVKIGSRCAQAALGVDLFVLVPEEDNNDYYENTTTNINNNNNNSSNSNNNNNNKSGDRHYKWLESGRKQHIPWYGLPLLRPLSESSGSPGPLMFGTANIGKVEDHYSNNNNNNDGDNNKDTTNNREIEKFERLHENLLARTPWQSGMVFGAQMRLRLSPGFQLETTAIEREPNTELQLAPFLSTGGLVGPAIALGRRDDEDGNGGDQKGAAADEDDDDDDGLWVMGTCDPHTSFAIDLETTTTTTDGGKDDELPDSCEMEGFGIVALKPVMQTCTLFTCIETDASENDGKNGTNTNTNTAPNYYTVCKMRVSSVSLEFADDVESIYDAVDPEALAVILYHKIALDAYMTGLVEAQATAEIFLKSLMGCVYKSAQEEQAKIDELMELELEEEERDDDDNDNDEDDSIAIMNPNFVACERLLEEEGGDLEEPDVLLGQGHFKMNIVPLLVYAIMQSDALRPCGGSFQPSMDARLCAMTQMASMTPKTLAKTFAPSLSLWSLTDDEPILESLPLSRDGILSALEDYFGGGETNAHNEENTILLLESSQRVILFRSDDLGDKRGGRGGSGSVGDKKKQPPPPRPITIGSELGSAILTALTGFRTAPPHWKALERFLENQGGDLNDLLVGSSSSSSSSSSPSVLLRSMLVEDKSSASGDRDFNEWKLRMAESIREDHIEIDEDDDDDDDQPPSGLRRLLPFWKK